MSLAPPAARTRIHASERVLTRVAALVAAMLLLVNVVLAIIAPDQIGDHATVAGRLSEGLVGLSFVAGALALAALHPRGPLARIFWVVAIIGLVASGLTMVGVLVSTVEPPFQLFLAEVAITAPALIGVGIIGIVPELSDRERSILDQLAAGAPIAQIARALHLSEKSVRNYLTGIPRRLGVADRAASIARAREAGLGR